MYIIFFPFLPTIWWWLDNLFNKPDQSIVQVNNAASSSPIPSGYWLDIPRLKMHEEIHNGPSISELHKGIWHRPLTSTPDKGSNTVLVGHRFTYTDPKGVFYFLDKIQKNDRITMDWKGTEYTYRVVDIVVVPPSAVEIESPSEDARLTLYTCTPLLTAKDRLAIRAELVAKRSS